MTENMFNQEGWLQLGVAGAALLILLVFVFMYMRNNIQSIDRLCSKIDRLVDSNSDTTKALATTLTQWNIEQKNNSNYLEQISKATADQNSKLDSLHGKMDALIKFKCKVEE